MIPKKIHHMHRTGDWSKDAKGHVTERCLKSFREINPDYEIVLWTDDMIFKFMKEEYGDYYDTWLANGRGCIGHLKKWDTARLCLLLKHGGFYIDNDISCLRPLDDLLDYSFVTRTPLYRWDLKNHYTRAIFCELGSLDMVEFDYTPPHTCNAFFGCQAGDPTVKLLIDTIKERSKAPEQSVCTGTGCLLWGQILEKKIQEQDLEGVRLLALWEFAEGAEKLGWIDMKKFDNLYALHKAWEWQKAPMRWKCFPEKKTREEAERLNSSIGEIQ